MRNKKLFMRLMAAVLCSALLATTPVMTYAAPEPELGEVESEPGEAMPEPEEGTTAPGVDVPEFGTEDDEENTEAGGEEDAPPQADENGFVIDDGVLIRYEGDATDVVVPSTVTSIGVDVFLHGAYESITIPGTVKHINVMVESVKKLVLEEGVESIEVLHIFERNVSEVVIPSTVTSIGKCSITSNPVFYVGSSYYSKPLFGDLYVTKGSYAEKYFSENPVGLNVLSVYNNGCVTVQAMTGQAKGQEILLDYQGTSEKVVIPEDVDAICYGFSEYNNTDFVSEIILHDNLVYIAGNAFSDTVWMENLRKENPVVVVNDWLLDARTASGEVVIPENVQIMGNAFYENKEVTKVVIPEGVTKIGYGWFQDCIALTEVVIPATVTEFEGDQEDCGIPFWGCESLKTISYGGTKAQWKTIDLFERYGEFHFSECPGVTVNCTDGSITYDTEGNVVAETDGKPGVVQAVINASISEDRILTVENNKDLTRYTVSISQSYIEDRDRVEKHYANVELVLSDDGKSYTANLSIINDLIKNLEHGDEVIVNLCAYDVNENRAYKTFRIEVVQTVELDDNDCVTVSGEGKIASLAMYVVSYGVKTIVIEDGISGISQNAFYSFRDVTSVTIPKSVETVWVDAFKECESLTDIYYAGTKTEWNNILKVDENDTTGYLDGVTIHCANTEEKPAIVEGWKKDSTGWWYQNADGTYPANCWKFIGNKWYAFNKNGYMREGWFYDGGKWYYLIPGSGQMAIGWAKDGNTWYYMNSSGTMTTGWIRDGGTWYYMKSSGAMATGWVNDGGTWYYMKSSGAMATGWVNDGGTWYYMKSTGAMATGWVKDGGTWYYLKSSGAMATGWIQDGGTWYYLSSSGAWVA